MDPDEPVIPDDFLGAFGLLDDDARGGVLLVANRRRIDGVPRAVWDLPGGGVEAGETLHEALVREMREETGLVVEPGALLFVQEGERVIGGRRVNLWRSFFFAVRAVGAVSRHSADPEVLDSRHVPRADLPGVLTAPYHAGFLRWLGSGGALRFVFDTWADAAPVSRRASGDPRDR